MIYSNVERHRHWFLFFTLFLISCLIGCQGGLSAIPVETETPAMTPTATLISLLREAPATLPITPVPTAEDETLELFEYDRDAPLDVEVVTVAELTSYIHHEITYASPKGGRVPASLLVPKDAPGPFAGIILMHGLPGDRTNNASFARRLVATGAVLLMIDAPFARPENRNRSSWPLTFDEVDRLEQIQLMIDLRRGVDLLISRDDVDPERLAYVGYSYGGAMGGLLAGIEPRIKAFGLMVGDGGLVSHFTGADGVPLTELSRLSDEDREAWLELMEPIEPLRFVGRAAPGHLFFQNALRDDAVTREDALAYQAAGSDPKQIEWYESSHFLPDEAFQHMANWLGAEIEIDVSRFIGP